MAAGRDPIDRVIDLAIAAPVCSLIAARRAARIPAMVARRRLTRAEQRPDAIAPRASLAPLDAAIVVATVSPPDDEQTLDLPIDGYDHLAARQVVDRLSGLRPDELETVAAYERSHRHRQTVLHKIDQLKS
jgi:hypothetical protein